MSALDIPEQVRLLKEIAECLSQASGAASQLIHQLDGDPRFIIIRQSIDLTKEGVMKVATFNAKRSIAVSKH